MPIGQFLIFFILLLIGFLCKRFKVFSDSAVNGINTFVINISYPCLILARTTAMEMEHNIFINFVSTGLIYLGMLFLFAAYSRLYCHARRFPDEERPAIELAIISPNNGFMGFPIALTFFGDLGLLYMVACSIALNCLFFTYGIKLMNRGRGVPGESMLKKFLKFLLMLAYPKVSAAIIGVVLCYNHISLPKIAEDFCELVGGVATPMAMISIGTMLAGSFGFHSFRKRAIIEPALNKLFVIPALCAVIVWFLPLDPLCITTLIVCNALPIAATVPILCEQYKRDSGSASEALVITTIFSIVTIPLLIWGLGALGV